MDPNANLEAQRRLVALILKPTTATGDQAAAALRLAELIGALDEWLSRGGFLPDTWQPRREPAKPSSHQLEAEAERCDNCGRLGAHEMPTRDAAFAVTGYFCDDACKAEFETDDD